MGQHVGFLGTGLMGRPMIERLLAASIPVAAWNRTPGKAEPLRLAGATVLPSAAAAAEGADILCVVLENADAVEQVLFDPAVIAALSPGTVVADLSSLHPEAARRNAGRLGTIGVTYLDAPVSGGPQGAAEGTLAVMVGGDAGGFSKAAPILNQFGCAIHVGPPGSGQITKLGSQIISGAALAAVAEALLLFTETGVSVDKAREALFGGFADSKILRIHGQRMISRDFAPGGHVRTFLKDLNAAADMARQGGLQLAVASLARDLFESLAAAGHGEDDISAMAIEVERRNGDRSISAGVVGQVSS